MKVDLHSRIIRIFIFSIVIPLTVVSVYTCLYKKYGVFYTYPEREEDTLRPDWGTAINLSISKFKRGTFNLGGADKTTKRLLMSQAITTTCVKVVAALMVIFALFIYKKKYT